MATRLFRINEYSRGCIKYILAIALLLQLCGVSDARDQTAALNDRVFYFSLTGEAVIAAGPGLFPIVMPASAGGSMQFINSGNGNFNLCGLADFGFDIAGQGCGTGTFTTGGGGSVDGAAPVPFSSKVFPATGVIGLNVVQGNQFCSLFSLPIGFSFLVDMTSETIEVSTALNGIGTFASPFVPPSTSTTAASTDLYDLVLKGEAHQITGPVQEMCAVPPPIPPAKRQ